MEDVKDLLGRLMTRVAGSGVSDEDLKRQIDAIYSIYAGVMGPEQIIVQASRYNAVKYIHDENPRIRLIGMERMILESRDYSRQPTDEEVPAIIDKLEDKLASMLARQAVERQLEDKIADRLEERHQEYIDEIRREIIEEETGDAETAQSRRHLEKLKKLDGVHLTSTVMEAVRPQHLSDIVGQEQAVKALQSRIASPFPQHLILYGPPGGGKTTVVRKIIESLPAGEVVLLPQDSYYKDSSHVPVEERQNINFDHPDAFEWSLLSKHVAMLREGKSIEQPTYSYLTCTREPETIHIEPREVVIIEGILALCDKKLRSMMDLKIFVDADPDERLIRVIQRDVVERGRTAEAVMERYTRILKPMHLQFIEPCKRYADLIIPEGGNNQVAIDILTMYIKKHL